LIDTPPRILLEAYAEAGTVNTMRKPEYFWLCGECSLTMEVAVDRNGSVVIATPARPGLSPHQTAMTAFPRVAFMAP